MHQLLQAQWSSGGGGVSNLSGSGSSQAQKSVKLNELISLSSFEIVKNLRIPLYVYLGLVIFEMSYMIVTPAQHMVIENPIVTTKLMESMTGMGVYIFTIIMTVLLLLQTLFILIRGKNLKDEQAKGNERGSQSNSNSHHGGGNKGGNIVETLTKASGIFLIVMPTIFAQFFMRLIPETFNCDLDYEIEIGCDSVVRQVTIYFSITSIPLILFLLSFSDIFITRLFPHPHLPWAQWNDRSRLLRDAYKLIQVIAITYIPPQYQVFVNFGVVFIAFQIVYERGWQVPQVYNRAVHIVVCIFECELFVFTLMAFIVAIIDFKLTFTGLIFVGLSGIILAVLLIVKIDRKEEDALALGNDMANFENESDVELYLVVMLHELERLTNDEEYAHQKHIQAIIGRHMEDCKDQNCICKNYEPEYDKKFMSGFSRKQFTKSYSSMMVGSMSSIGKSAGSSMAELKRLPFKINYKTKVEIFKREFENRIEMFLEEHPKSYGIKLLQSFFHHKYCDSSYKALFVQLENSLTCKNFKGTVFIYHLKTQIQDEMKKSTESPLTLDINSLLRFEKYKLDFERNLEDLSFNCQTFWTDLTKDDYKVENTLKVAYSVADKIIVIKHVFQKLITINPQCIDTSSIYALIYRHILRDESTFTELVNRIQQIKNSAKLEQMREIGIRFFDSDIYGLLMVSGEVKELGRIKQANSSVRFVFGFDPKELIGSRINKLMPVPYSALHDRFMVSFLNQGNSRFLDKNQPLPVITKEGFLQMTLFYIKPIVSLEFGLIFACFSKKMNHYTMGLEDQELIKVSKLCIFVTDKEGVIHGMSETCTKRLGIPPPSVGQQLSLNDNQKILLAQICPQIASHLLEIDVQKKMKVHLNTLFLKKERQFRREYPDIACNIGQYLAELGLHKFSYPQFSAEINLYVFKILETQDTIFQLRNHKELESQISRTNDELTYSEFSITTANSSVISSHMATTKFKTFKSKIQAMTGSSQITYFARIAFVTFLLLLGIAAGNFTINLLNNQSFMSNLDVITNIQYLLQTVPSAAQSTRQLTLLSNRFVRSNDTVINLQISPSQSNSSNTSSTNSTTFKSKYHFYASQLGIYSQLFENIQNTMQSSSTMKQLVQLDQRQIQVRDVKTDGDIRQSGQSIQTSINIFSSKILRLAAYGDGNKGGKGLEFGIVVPKISLNWNETQRTLAGIQIGSIEQDLYFVIENGLGSIKQGLESILEEEKQDILDTSQQSNIISIVLTAISIVLVLILLPLSYQPLTHVERISQLILMSLNRLPEKFCLNETKSCMEIIMFLNEQKEGEKSTHEMIKKHNHRKQNQQVLKMPRKYQGANMDESIYSSNVDSDSVDFNVEKQSLIMQGKKKSASGGNPDTESTHSRTSLGKEPQNDQQLHKIQRGEGGAIELDLLHAKSSDLLEEEEEQQQIDDEDGGQGKDLTEEEQKQKDRERERKEAINSTFRQQRIKKFSLLIVTSIVISIYYGITCLYLSLIHNYEVTYLEQYSLVGRRIQCYTNVGAYLIDSLARNSNITLTLTGDSGKTQKNAAWYYLQDCYKQEQDFKQLMLDGMTIYKNLDTFNDVNDQYQNDRMCKTLLDKFDQVDPLRSRSFTKENCEQVLQGILINGGLTQALYTYLKNMQDVLIQFEERNSSDKTNITRARQLLLRQETNEFISLNEIYFHTAFEQIRDSVMVITRQYFKKLTNYYNMLFGLFVSFLTIFQIVVALVIVKRLSKQIVKIYHIVLLVPFSGRTQNDLNTLMMVKM